MTSAPAEPSPRALGESLAALAVQVASLRDQVRLISDRLDQGIFLFYVGRFQGAAGCAGLTGAGGGWPRGQDGITRQPDGEVNPCPRRL
jgi:hypothetical protein